MAAGMWGQDRAYNTVSATTWDTSTSNNLLYVGSAKSEAPKRTALEWLDDRIDEMREMGRELLTP